MAKPWDWRKGRGMALCRTDYGLPFEERHFHAYDVNDHAACEPIVGLARSAEPPNEGSRLCPECIEVMQAQPSGRR